MKVTTKEVLDLLFEFVLSLVIFLVGSYMIMLDIATEFFTGIMTLVVGYWFQKRSNESAVKTLLTDPPKNQKPTTEEPATNVQEKPKEGLNI